MKKNIFIALLFIIILGSFLRLYRIDSAPPGLYPDEAMNGNNALEALATGDFKVFYSENNGREGFFINVQALSLKYFGNEPWALRVVSAIFGILAIIGTFAAARELFRFWNSGSTILRIPYADAVALASAFFIATSFWHLNFSRVGFRAIMIPFVCSFALYFLMKGLRRGTVSDLVLAGLFAGLGTHTYIAFRFMPFVLIILLVWYFLRWWSLRANNKKEIAGSCAPCGIVLYLFAAFLAFLPIGIFYVQHPEDFFGRTSQVAIFSAESPALEFAKSNIATLGMFFARGDCNWRHNFGCKPELNFILMPFFVIGVFVALRNVFGDWKAKIKNFEPMFLSFSVLIFWSAFMSFPATLTREGLPHALRAIGMIPPVMILSAVGAVSSLHAISAFFARKAARLPDFSAKILRIRKEAMGLVSIALLFIPIMTYRDYFNDWASNPNTYFAFAADMAHAGEYLELLPDDIAKYVVVNLPGTDVRAVPMPSQTVMFITDTFREQKRIEKNIRYVLPEEFDALDLDLGEKSVVLFLDGTDRDLIGRSAKKYSGMRISAPGDFVTLENR